MAIGTAMALLIGSAIAGAAAVGSTAIATHGKDKGGEGPAAPTASAASDVGNVGDVGSLESQAAARRLARMSKYFTTPTGVMGGETGSAGVF